MTVEKKELKYTPDVPSYSLELLKACNNNCLYCYNVWKRMDYHSGEMGTEETKKIIDKLFSETKPRQIVLSGGEPLLREDLPEIIAHLHKKGCSVLVISNGVLLSDEERLKRCLESGPVTFEITLLSHRPEVHNYLVQNDAWEKAIAGIKNVKKNGARLALTFIATELNIPDYEETLKLSISLGADQLVLNRVNLGGNVVRYINEIMPDITSLIYALGIADFYGWKYGYKINSTIPIQPCLVYPDKNIFRYVTYNSCSVGTKYGSYVIDPAGFVRPCSLSCTILGDFKKSRMKDILNNSILHRYCTPVPSICRDCGFVGSCRGGCRAAAESCYGSADREDPFLRLTLSAMRIKELYPPKLK
jgi:radical SAM protein with 4Fe4S-binding SPASM domain